MLNDLDPAHQTDGTQLVLQQQQRPLPPLSHRHQSQPETQWHQTYQYQAREQLSQ